MKTTIAAFVFAFLCLAGRGNAQISHGGTPLPITVLKSSVADNQFVDMPSFDVSEELRLDSLNQSDLRSGFRFAYKFMTSYNRNNSGHTFTLADGTKVWRLGIRSSGAYSINILFSEYKIPKGGQVFLYNPDQTQILGSFTSQNNSDLDMLPVAPIQGDEIIIEYQEPANAEFSGRLTVGEVNHAYIDLRGDEPRGTQGLFYCMDNLVCDPNYDNQYEEVGRSVVMLLIDGTIACTGTLVNNTEKDGTPFLLTASHCLNNLFKVTNPDYAKVASSIVCFFNYNSPICSPAMRGTEEQSMASAVPRAINEKTDLALLTLKEVPPVYYRPYYAGWNAMDAGISPYTGIHHPGGSVKRINKFNGTLTQASFSITDVAFKENTHWLVSRWTDGSTAGGSSGSPLFDSEDQIVGALSGGSSMCYRPVNDYYFSLKESWSPDSTDAVNTLSYWLDPKGNGQNICEGMDPYADSTCIRLSNVTANGNRNNIEALMISQPDSGYVFGTNSTNPQSFAEAYSIPGQYARVYGSFLVTPAAIGKWTDSKMTISVYEGSDKPETFLYSEEFKPTYANYDTTQVNFIETDKPLSRDMETFVPFTKPVYVKDKFYITYTIQSVSGDTIAVFNLKSGVTTNNTALVKHQGTWAPAPFATSLFIDPVIQYTDPGEIPTGIVADDLASQIRVFTGTDREQLYVLIPGNSKEVNVSLLSATGKLLLSNSYHADNIIIPVNNFPSGIYIVKVKTANNQIAKKVVL